ncbi:hypothetical protein [Candidatus Rhabdochlamydia sp. T3358]|uniref:hypothetical protein n=1 Tax=Candidatus Rhabdochlamydia sp. T3358 TaxID=2099795 RepID=UPI0010B9513E|nr:hypothetical protein [Candidatus Rhabdochlamydia sp. T3358]VHO04129.1 hypothetical protein RHT_01215 [Candidatus Rhabdochlamydia sp. T3358]
MSAIAPVQAPEIKDANPAQDLQQSTSLHGRVFHKISDGGKCIIQSINKVAQSILSTCIYVGSFGRCDLNSLKNYLFSNQSALKGDETASSNHSLKRPEPLPPNAPPPPPEPTLAQLNRASASRDLGRSPTVRSSTNSTQDFTKGNENRLEADANSRPTSSSSLHEDSDSIIEEQNNNEPDVSPQKKAKGIQKKIDQGKQAVGNLFEGVKDSPLFKKMKSKVN